MSEQPYEDYGGPMARYSEYRPKERVGYRDATGQFHTGAILYVTEGPCCLYVIENQETGFPEVLQASEIIALMG